jgi:predicted amidohydrolase
VKVRVAVIQQKANDIDNCEKGLATSLELIELAVLRKPDLIVLPECIYPGYFLGLHGVSKDALNGALQGLENALREFCTKAREHKIHLVLGAPERDAGKLYNSAYLIGPEGKILGTARKSFLWHFDNEWFTPSAEYPIYETALGRLGMIICADGRQPEISRILALKGAQIIVDVTNLVTTGPNIYQLSNPQYDYMLPSRAVENKVWFIVANKVGTETDSIVCCGKSCIISPSGHELAVASSYQEEIITAVIDVSMSDDKLLNKEFDVMGGRNPRLYSLLGEDKLENLPIMDSLNEKVLPGSLSLYAGTVQLKEDLSLDGFLAKMKSIVPLMALQGSKLLVFPELASLYEEGAEERLLPVATLLASDYGVALVLGTVMQKEGQRVKAGVLVLPGGECFYTEKCHLDAGERQHFAAGSEQNVFKTPFGRVGILMGYEGLIPEVSRLLMLKGADLFCWMTNFSSDYHKLFARTRAAENRVFLMVANTWGKKGCGLSLIANPGGNISAFAFDEGDQVVSSQLDLVLARCKTVVHGTDLLINRLPNAYGKLTEV